MSIKEWKAPGARALMEQKIASPEDVRRAIESLTPAEFVQLNTYAENRIARLGVLAGYHDAGDLVQEAMQSLLDEGRRYWDPTRVGLVGVLMGAMRSIASNWARKSAKLPMHLSETDPIHTSTDGTELHVFDTISAPGPNPEELLIMAERQTYEQFIRQVENMFCDDTITSLVIDGWKTKAKGPAIMEALGISEKELRAAEKRIRRKVRARWPGGKPHVQ